MQFCPKCHTPLSEFFGREGILRIYIPEPDKCKRPHSDDPDAVLPARGGLNGLPGSPAERKRPLMLNDGEHNNDAHEDEDEDEEEDYRPRKIEPTHFRRYRRSGRKLARKHAPAGDGNKGSGSVSYSGSRVAGSQQMIPAPTPAPQTATSSGPPVQSKKEVIVISDDEDDEEDTNHGAPSRLQAHPRTSMLRPWSS